MFGAKISEIWAVGIAITLAITVGSLINCASAAGDAFHNLYGARTFIFAGFVLRVLPEEPIANLAVSAAIGFLVLAAASRHEIPLVFLWSVTVPLLLSAICLFALVAPNIFLMIRMGRKFGDSNQRYEGSTRWVDEALWIIVAVCLTVWARRILSANKESAKS